MYETSIDEILKAQNKDMEAMTNIIERNSGLVWSIVKRFTGRGYETEDLYQIGCLGFIKAIQRYDVTFETKISTYAVPYILGEIKRFIRDDGMIKVSRSIKELAIKIRDLQNQYKEKEELTINKIAELLDASVEDINLALEATRPIESINEEAYNDGDKNNVSKIEQIENKKDEMQNIVNKIAIKDLIGTLKEKEKQIILLRYYRGKTQTQVSKMLGISQVQVSRIERKILDYMKEKLAS